MMPQPLAAAVQRPNDFATPSGNAVSVVFIAVGFFSQV
jgi:hypothetical protein